MSSLHPRKFTGFECDHLRPKVHMNGQWYHVSETTGEVLGECVAGTYRVEATYSGSHYITDLIREDVE